MDETGKANGCSNRKCPCAMWVNCSRYVDMYLQYQRLMTKKRNPFIEEWYRTYFRREDKMVDIFGNG